MEKKTNKKNPQKDRSSDIGEDTVDNQKSTQIKHFTYKTVLPKDLSHITVLRVIYSERTANILKSYANPIA